MVSRTPLSPPANMRSMVFRPRLSLACTLKRSPPAMSCVSPEAFESTMMGDCVSGWTPPIRCVVSHAYIASASDPMLRIAVLPLTSRISILSAIGPPASLPAGGDQIVDDVGRDQYQEITPILCLA